MPCAAGELYKLPDVELIASNGRDCGHECLGGCGGRLHVICGEVEDPDGDGPTHRICHTCISNRNLSNPAKHKQDQCCVLQRASKNKSGASGAKKPRKRLNLGEKLEVLALLDKKVSYADIARRHSAPVRLWHHSGRIGEKPQGDPEGGRIGEEPQGDPEGCRVLGGA